jgi:hypothetical protein
MLLGEYRFRGVLEDEALLPPYKGSTLRGVFGRALKEVVCALKHQECPSCLLRGQCLYVAVFDPPAGAPSRASPPPPFVLEPPLSPKTQFSPGEPLEFTLLLFGKSNAYLPYFVYAFEHLGRLGLGKALGGRRARFRLLSVTCATAGVIYQEKERLLLPARPQELVLPTAEPPRPGVGQLTVSLLTPLRLKFQNRLQAELPFHVLLRAVLRRIATLFKEYGNGEPPLDYRGLSARAQKVQTRHSSLNWCDWKRYSHRQEQAMLLGGLLGDITYQGELGEFLPFLSLAEKLHVGKNTTFGLGKLKITGISHGSNCG